MKSIEKNLKKHLKILCEDIGPRYYWGENSKKASDYITSVLSTYDGCLINKKSISVPYLHNRECYIKVTSPEKKDLPCLPWAGFLPFFPAVSKGSQESLELSFFTFGKKRNSNNAVLMDFSSESSFCWDLLGVEKNNPEVIILIDNEAEDYKHLKFGTSDLLINIMVMPLLKSNVPKILISRSEGNFLKTLLKNGKKVFIDFSSFSDEERAKVTNIEASFSSRANFLLWAHYDSSWECPGCPGANDNASSVAIALELMRLLQSEDTGRRIKVLFAGAEECSAFSGISHFMNTEDFLESDMSRMALMLMSMRAHERVLPVVKPLVKSRYFRSLLKKEPVKHVDFCLELECLGWGRAFQILTPAKSLFSQYFIYFSSQSRKPLLLVPQNLGLETHWINLYKKASLGVLCGDQRGYPFHTCEDVPSRLDISVMKDALLLVIKIIEKFSGKI